MSYTSPIPIRFPLRSDSQLAEIARKTGLTKAELIRIAVNEFIVNTEMRGEVVQHHPMINVEHNQGNVIGTVVGNASFHEGEVDENVPRIVIPRKDAKAAKAAKKKK